MPYPINHVGGFSYAVLVPFVSGATVVLMERWDPAVGKELIQRESVTFLSAIPAVVRSLIDQPGFDQSKTASVRTVALGGTRVTRQEVALAAETFRCSIKRGYGLTEMPTFSSTNAILDADDEEAGTDGRPAGASLLRIVGEDGRECPIGKVGEIQVQGPELFVGYLQAQLDQDAFTADGFFRTGDSGVLDIEGRLSVSGRIKDVIIRNGENISAAELEELLLLHPSVTDVAVIGVQDEKVGERVCAVVEVVGSRSLTLEEVCKFLLERGLSKFKVPEMVEIRDVLPRTANEKIDKRLLRASLSNIQST
jgi:cyclohexanecarboxylate-CoA ligase